MQWIKKFELPGILFDPDPCTMVVDILRAKIHKNGKFINHLKRFQLSVIGKVNVLKS